MSFYEYTSSTYTRVSSHTRYIRVVFLFLCKNVKSVCVDNNNRKKKRDVLVVHSPTPRRRERGPQKEATKTNKRTKDTQHTTHNTHTKRNTAKKKPCLNDRDANSPLDKDRDTMPGPEERSSRPGQ